MNAPSATAVKGIWVANAPCSWGVLEFEEAGQPPYSPEQVLNEIAETGYEGTELGPYGFLPTEPQALKEALERRGLAIAGTFVPIALADETNHEPGLREALKTAKLIAEAASEQAPPPRLVLSDDNGKDPVRVQNAGRIRPEQGLPPERFRAFAKGAERIARAVFEETGLKTAFHPHCAGFVETPQEIQRLMELTDPDVLGLCFDTGHYTYGGGDALEGLKRFRERIWHVHLKDCSQEIAEQARRESWDYFRAVGAGLFPELRQGIVDFPAVVEELERSGYSGWAVVEQDVLFGPDAKPQINPKESARCNRTYLQELGL